MNLSVANQGVWDLTQAADIQDALVRIEQAQQHAFTEFTAQNRSGFLTTGTFASTTGNGNRTVDLSAQPVQRIVRVTLAASGIEVANVNPAVPTTEMAPRYYTRGETLVEVSNDWDTTTSASASLTVLYASRPVALVTVLGSALTQTVSVPDRWTDVLVYELGAYLATKDIGRDDSEAAGHMAVRAQVLADWVAASAQFGGVEAYTFDIPTPEPASKS